VSKPLKTFLNLFSVISVSSVVYIFYNPLYMNKKIKRKAAVALKYSPKEDGAPKVTAKGGGFIADKILELAKKHNIPIKEDPDLVQVLAKLDIDKEIPPSVYKVVAEILSFVYSVSKKYNKSPQG